MLTISNFHRSALEMQKFLTRVIKFSFKESWRNRIRILVCLSEWMTKLLELFGYADLNDADVDVPITTTDTSITTTDTDISSIGVTDLSTIIKLNDDNFYIKNNQHSVVRHRKNR